MRCEECQTALESYLDGELPPDEAQRVREHVASCADCAAEHRMLTDLSQRVREGAERPRAPDVLKARIRNALAAGDAGPAVVTKAGLLAWPRLLAAGVLIAALSSGTTYIVTRGGVPEATVSDEVMASHIRSLMPGHLTDVASTDLHNVKPWFNGRVDLSPSVPRLDSAGFPLIGGRLDYIAGRRVAAVVYARRQHMINVFSWPVAEAADASPVVAARNGYHVVHWRSGGAELWAVSDVSVGDLNQFVALFARSDSASVKK